MKNTFKFSYLTPTPDTLANIALCRWNDALKGLPAFIQIYMQSQHFLQGFGFSRALSYKEYLNKKITKDTDLKVYVGGYEINLSELLVDHDLDLVKISSGALNLVTFFRITFETEEVLLDSNFISHDGTSIPVTEQNITITVELCYSDSTNWNFETQKPLSDLRGNTASALFDMENDDNSDGLYGRDCTLWTTPTEKTIYGYKWQCALPISFLMPDNLSVSNIYFDRQSGEFEALYTVPVVKRFFQNIEKAIYDTHLLNCLHDYNKTEEEIDENNNEYIVVGGVNLDENTENLYPVAEDNDHIQIEIAEINSHITEIDTSIEEIDTSIEEISNDITTINSRMVTTHSINSETVGDNQDILGEKSFNNRIYAKGGADVNNSINILSKNENYTLSLSYGIDSNSDSTDIASQGKGYIYTTYSAQPSGNELLVFGVHDTINTRYINSLSLCIGSPLGYFWKLNTNIFPGDKNISIGEYENEIYNIFVKNITSENIKTNKITSSNEPQTTISRIPGSTKTPEAVEALQEAFPSFPESMINSYANNIFNDNPAVFSYYLSMQAKNLLEQYFVVTESPKLTIKGPAICTSQFTFKSIYFDDSVITGNIKINAKITPKPNTNIDLGSLDNMFYWIYANNITVDDLYSKNLNVNNTATIHNLTVNNTATIDTLTVNNTANIPKAVLPHVQFIDHREYGEIIIPVGALICIHGDNNIKAILHYPGQIIEISDDTSPRIDYLASLDNSIITESYPQKRLVPGKYVCLSYVKDDCALLVQRIE